MRFFNSKKVKIGVVLILLIIAIWIIEFNNKNKSIQTMCKPIQNKKIVLDAGHGAPDERCIK